MPGQSDAAKSHRSRLALFSLLGIFLLALIGFLFWPQKPKQSPEHNQPVVAADARIPPAPPPLPSSKRKSATNSPSASSIQALTPELALSYDESLTFGMNLLRLKEFCRSHSSDPRLQQLLDAFVKRLLAHAKTELPAIERSLQDMDGTAAYRNLLLMCLSEADGGISEKAAIVWRIVLDSREPVEVRRTASFLTTRLGDDHKRPAELFALLSDSDSQVVVFALQGATPHLDQQNYDLIQTNLIHSLDVHVQVAAVNAIGNAPFTNRQAVLMRILTTIQTSNEEAFSELSLLKRAAIAHLDMQNPTTFEAVKRIALDENEDPGVRAKAILRFTPKEFPQEADMLVGLLKKPDSVNAVTLRAVVDTLLTAPTPDRVQMIHAALRNLADPEIKKLLFERIRIATEGENP
jgi:hypothetical protein